MKTIGIEINNNRAIFFVLESYGTDIVNITNNFKHLKLEDDKDNIEIQNFQSIIFNYFDSINPDRIAVISRQSKGPYSSSSISFKIEALMQCYPKIKIEFFSPQTISSFYKKNLFEIGISHKYQEKAAQLSNFLIINK